jgi:hypothetical protein
VRRLNVNLNEETMKALLYLAHSRDATLTEAVRRAIAVTRLIEAEVAAGGSVQVVDAAGRVREIVLL